MISIEIENPDSADACILLEELSEALQAITGSSGKSSFDTNDVRLENARFVVARDSHGQPVGCGAFRPFQENVAEVKRMYSRPGTTGVGSAILSFLEKEAEQIGYQALILETRLVNERAVRFYERHGYENIPNYGKYLGNVKAACFEKKLVR
ncbi:MAG: GNAT family N-acetyltransferase [Pseudomonadota bacterium]